MTMKMILLIGWLIIGPLVMVVMIADEELIHAFQYGVVWFLLVIRLIAEIE